MTSFLVASARSFDFERVTTDQDWIDQYLFPDHAAFSLTQCVTEVRG